MTMCICMGTCTMSMCNCRRLRPTQSIRGCGGLSKPQGNAKPYLGASPDTLKAVKALGDQLLAICFAVKPLQHTKHCLLQRMPDRVRLLSKSSHSLEGQLDFLKLVQFQLSRGSIPAQRVMYEHCWHCQVTSRFQIASGDSKMFLLGLLSSIAKSAEAALLHEASEPWPTLLISQVRLCGLQDKYRVCIRDVGSCLY